MDLHFPCSVMLRVQELETPLSTLDHRKRSSILQRVGKDVISSVEGRKCLGEDFSVAVVNDDIDDRVY